MMQALGETFTEKAPMAGRKGRAPRYYIIDESYQGGLPWYKLVNKESLQPGGGGLLAKPAWPDGYGILPRHPYRFPEYLETPRLLFEKRTGKGAKDLTNEDGFWYVSRAMKELLERVDPEACEFRKCDTVWASGEPGPEYWLCSVARYLFGRDVIDFETTRGLKVSMQPSGHPSYHGLTLASDLRLRPEAIGSFHLFRLIGLGNYVFCDQFVKDACKEAGLKGLQFQKLFD
jgi:hypothetical protein